MVFEKRAFHEYILQLRFTPCKAEQALQGMEFKKKKHKNIKAYRKSV